LGKLYFTCSFDDGDVADLRLAELLDKYGFKATFYIPRSCDLVSESLSESQIRELASLVEIGGHTLTHSVLTSITAEKAGIEIDTCKKWLEDVTGKSIQSFCPPTGRFNQYHLLVQQEAGFKSMRTVEMLSYSLSQIKTINDFVIMPATIQVYNHSSAAYLKNLTKRLRFSTYPTFRKLFNPNWEQMSTNYIAYLNEISRPGDGKYFFHLWGHSWEIEKYSLWDSLEKFFECISEVVGIVPCTNSELAELAKSI
jgi:peptidoglycan-N-acetylglucosamine deacetylase